MKRVISFFPDAAARSEHGCGIRPGSVGISSLSQILKLWKFEKKNKAQMLKFVQKNRNFNIEDNNSYMGFDPFNKSFI